jgi:2-keto-4-pentenoate hydratase/2-oxohepta-3-ene-1,7-dioic acid hydratase in catechol pathway
VPNPDKIICVGLNYRSHILEMGRELPAYPTLVAKFAKALLGAGDDIVLPSASDQADREAELGVAIGTAVRRASAGQAAAAIAGRPGRAHRNRRASRPAAVVVGGAAHAETNGEGWNPRSV